MTSPTFRLRIARVARQLLANQIESVLYFDGATGYTLPDLGFDRLSILGHKLRADSRDYTASELDWMHQAARQMAAQLDGEESLLPWEKREVDALDKLVHDIERMG